MTPDPDPLELAHIAETLQAAPTPGHTAEEIVDYVRGQLDADHAGLTLIRKTGLETIASTDNLVDQADTWQEELNEGPCQDRSWDRQTLSVDDLTIDGRWPLWAEKVAPLGIASILAAELTNRDDRRVGALTVYWTEPHGFTIDDISYVNIFAHHAAVALVESLKEADLNITLDSRKRIGQAQGILMERYDLDRDQALDMLCRYSHHHNVKLRQVAEHLVTTRQLPA
jgi:GAF domain-containing protein